MGGYGRWSEGTYTVQHALGVAGDTGLPLFKIDMGAIHEVETIIIARGSQRANEGDAGAIQELSVYVSATDSDYVQIIKRFQLPPGQNVQFKAGSNFDIGTSFRYIKIYMHSLGLYQWKGHTDSQFNVSEVQCYGSETIKGIAKLQNDDSSAANYDTYNILNRYGQLVHVARGGQPDEALYTQAKVDADAQDVLDEFKRLVAAVEIAAPHLPAVPLYSTIKIVNGAASRTVTFFVESRAFGELGDVYTGTTLP